MQNESQHHQKDRIESPGSRIPASFISAGLLASLLGCAILTSSCATKLQVESQPAGAQILWSPSGVDDWREWPPLTWNNTNSSYANGETALTPFYDSASYSNTIWITVEKDGYYRPLPELVELMGNRREEIFFELQETAEAKANRMEADGFVLWFGDWVRPEEKNLENVNGVWMDAADAFDLRQRNKGLVKYSNEWITPEEAKRRFGADQKAKGLISFKDRWVSPEIQSLEESIDQEVARWRDGGETIDLRLPRVVGSIDLDLAQLQIHNSSRFELRVLLSGARSQSLQLKPYETFGGGSVGALQDRLTIVPGRYDILVIPQLSETEKQQNLLKGTEDLTTTEGQVLKPAYTQHLLSAGFQYLMTYNPDGSSLEQGLGDYIRREASDTGEMPVIVIPEVETPKKESPFGGAAGRGSGGRGGGGGRN